MGFRVYVLGFRVSGLRGSSVKDPTPKHEKRTTSPMPNILTPATFLSFPVNAPEGSRATHTFCPYIYLHLPYKFTIHVCKYASPHLSAWVGNTEDWGAPPPWFSTSISQGSHFPSVSRSKTISLRPKSNTSI